MTDRRRLPRYSSYAAFWPAYLREHACPRTRLWHAVGTVCAVGLLAGAIALGAWWLALVGVVAGYGFAWASHAIVEHNRPATFTHPLWSLLSDLRMAWLMLTGRLGPELERAGLPGE